MTEMISAVAERVAERRARLSPAERQVAAVVLERPEDIAFGTVASLARQANTSGASVVRLAAKLGYDGFAGLQAAVQQAIGQQLRPAAERIHGGVPTSRTEVVARSLQAELTNVEQTLGAIDPAAFDQAVGLLSQRSLPVCILVGEAEAGVGAMLAASLDLLRPGVALVEGSDVAVARQLAHMPDDGSWVLVAMDLRRYERWVVEHTRAAAGCGASVIALTDTLLSPLAEAATVAFTIQAEGAGPFDSHVGTLALVNALVTGVAGKVRRSAAPRLDAVESAWRRTSALLDT
jgi:DNA-binding MurR/RpiR family transcriptional regulator